MRPGNVLIAGTLDTKGEKLRFLKERLEAAGVHTLLLDVGIAGTPVLTPDVDHTAGPQLQRD